jgi:hypothetical protein
MNLDVELQGIVREHEGDLLAFARKLYEHGYRQGLASRPSAPVVAAPAPVTEPAPATALEVGAPPPPPPAHGPLFPSRPKLVAVADQPDDTPEDDDTAADDEPAGCDHRVRGSITAAGLQKKIERMFDLSRFDIDVVICRRGDPERRRLKATVRLKNYLLDTE